MSEEKSKEQLIAEAIQKMDKVITRWFTQDPIMLGTWCMADKVADPNQKTIGIDSRTSPISVKFNPLFVNALPAEYLEAVMASECFKILLKHPTTRLRTPKTVSNMASQVTINSAIMSKTTVDNLIYGDAITAKKFNMEPDQYFEYYFKRLMENMPEAMQQIAQMFSKSIDQNGNPVGDGQGEGEGKDDSKDANGFQKFDKPGDAMKDYFDPTSTANQEWGVNDLLDAEVSNMVNEKKGSTKEWGKFSMDMMGQIVAASTPKISYKDLLRRFHNSVVATKQYASRMKVNRRHDLVLPGFKREFKSKLILAIDTSGSMSDDDIAEAFAVVNSICRHSQLEYILFDTKITLIEKNFKKAKASFKITARGGTDFQEVINYAEKQKSDGLIIYTDGYASAPTKPQKTKVLWLMSNKDCKPPVEWGMIATLDRCENVH